MGDWKLTVDAVRLVLPGELIGVPHESL
jgi:hypothetical protein